jgi:hypothetical protein
MFAVRLLRFLTARGIRYAWVVALISFGAGAMAVAVGASRDALAT